jgi:SAM-dependent methyltransferase
MLRQGPDKILQIRGRDWQACSPRHKASLVEGAFHYWRERGFPHYELTKSDVKREYRNLAAQPVEPITKDGIVGSITGLRLANFFQPQMWSVRVSRYLSPIDVFKSDTMLRAAIERSWSIWPDRFGANAATMRRILKTFPGTASVSNFRPTVARSVLKRFSPNGGTVVDFSSGYGGRLLGTLSSKCRYIGIEPCYAQVTGLRRMLDALKKIHTPGSAEILLGCAEDLMPQLPRAHADLVFSSPPYFNWEKYSHDTSQSFVRYSTYEAWREGFLQPILRESARVLRKDGYLVVNISGGRRKPDAQEVKSICQNVGLRYVGYIPLLITRVPYMHPRNNQPHKCEVLLIFEKDEKQRSRGNH